MLAKRRLGDVDYSGNQVNSMLSLLAGHGHRSVLAKAMTLPYALAWNSTWLQCSVTLFADSPCTACLHKIITCLHPHPVLGSTPANIL